MSHCIIQRELADQRRSDQLARMSDPNQSPPSKMAKLEKHKSKNQFHQNSGSRLSEAGGSSKNSKSRKSEEYGNGRNGINNGLQRYKDPSLSEKFLFKNENAKPGAEYLEAKVTEKEGPGSNKNETGFRLYSTQHR